MELITKLHGSNWIGLPEVFDKEIDFRKNQIVYFKHIFELYNTASMTLHISAHNRYKLYVNGQCITKGPCKGDPWRHYYESVDVTNLLRVGKNVLAVEVAYYPPNQYLNDRSGGPASIFTNVFGPWLIIKGIYVDQHNVKRGEVSTGLADWYVHLSKGYKWHKYQSTSYIVVGDFEELDSNKIPKEWKKTYDYDEFAQARVHWRADGTYFGELLPFTLEARKIPLLLNERHEFVRTMPTQKIDNNILFHNKESIRLESNQKYCIELDAGELMTGYLNIKTNHGKGSAIKITYAESYSKENHGQYPLKGVRDDSINYELHGYEDIYYPKEDMFTYEPFWYRTFRFIKIEVEVGEQPMELWKPYYYETGYPLEVVSHIESNESWIQSLWNISIRTLRRCMHETYYDCPYYEQLQYILDTRLEILFTYAITDDRRLPIKAIEDFHASLLPDGQLMCRYPSASRHVIPVFSLQWILMIQDYYEHTGKKDLIIRYRSTIDAILAWFHRHVGTYGLVEKFGHWHFVDWVEAWENSEGIATGTPNAAKFGPLTYDNLVYLSTLKVAAQLMVITGREDVAKEYVDKAAKIEIAINDYCYDEVRGLYMDGPGFKEFSQHCQVWAVLSRAAKGKRQKDILIKSFKDSSIAECSYAGSYFLFRALDIAGIYDRTWLLWEKWKQLLPLHLTTWPEDLTRHRSDCHGWGALPLFEFTRHILGVQPEKPGYESILIKPSFIGLEYASGEVITPKGIVTIDWKVTGEVVGIKGHVPEGVPFTLMINGEIVEQSKIGGAFQYEAKLNNSVYNT